MIQLIITQIIRQKLKREYFYISYRASDKYKYLLEKCFSFIILKHLIQKLVLY